MKKINTVIIGCGNISGLNEKDLNRVKPATHIGAINLLPKYNLKGVYDVDKKKSAYFGKLFKVKSFDNLSELLMNTNAELAVIAIPYKNNLKVFKKIFSIKNKIKYIFCEKPMSDTFINAQKIYNLCQKKKIKLFINNRRLDDGIQKLKKIVLNKKLGQLNYIEGRCSSGLLALGIHLIDSIRFITNKNFKFNVTLNDNFKKKSLKFSKNYIKDDPKIISISNSNKIICTLINSVRSKFSYLEIYLRFEKGRVYYDQSKNYLDYEYLSSKKKRSSIDYLIDRRKKIFFQLNSIFLSNYNYLYKNFSRNKNLLSGKESLENMRIIEDLKKKNI